MQVAVGPTTQLLAPILFLVLLHLLAVDEAPDMEVRQVMVSPVVLVLALGGLVAQQAVREIRHPHHQVKETLGVMALLRLGLQAAAVEPVQMVVMA
jgi:hypothetical protein